MFFVTLFSEMFALLPVLLLTFPTVIADRIAKVLKGFYATQTVVLDI